MKFVSRFLLLLPVLLLLAWSCAKEVAIPVTIDFLAAPANATYTSVPVSISVANRTSGAEVYHWTFEGGIPATSEAKNPPLIVYQQAGTYKITLQASNSDGRVDTKTQTIQIDASLTADFGMTTIDNAYPPLTLVLANKSVGGTTFAWTFDGGTPATSMDKDPKVIFEQPGTHTISLKVSNGRVTRQKDTTITVAPDLVPDFTYVPDNAELEAPLVVAVTNATTSATSYTWASGGTLSSPGAKEPTITFAKAGTYTISLTASNGKKTKTVDKTITVKPSTGIYTATDVVLGINTAQSTIGSFYSTSLHKTFK
ncbi:MAG: PKD domain-containing protein, partial [Cytophagaceae bacterium]